MKTLPLATTAQVGCTKIFDNSVISSSPQQLELLIFQNYNESASLLVAVVTTTVYALFHDILPFYMGLEHLWILISVGILKLISYEYRERTEVVRESEVIQGFLTVQGIGTSNPCVVQRSIVTFLSHLISACKHLSFCKISWSISLFTR